MLVWTLATGALTGWYPYPFIDVGERGWAPVLVTSAGVTGLVLLLCGAVVLVERRSPSAPAATTVAP